MPRRLRLVLAALVAAMALGMSACSSVTAPSDCMPQGQNSDRCG